LFNTKYYGIITMQKKRTEHDFFDTLFSVLTNRPLGNDAVGREAGGAVHGELVGGAFAKAFELEEVGAGVAPLVVVLD
jgi:hypothetical protein